MGKAKTPEQKARSQKQRAMQREIYERLDEEARKEFVETRQSESQERTKERKAKVKFFQDCVKKGIEYARKNRQDLLFFDGMVGEYGVSASAIRKTAEDGVSAYYQIGFTFRKPTDFYSSRIARGMSAYRIMDGVTHPYQFKIGLTSPGGINPKRLRAIIETHIQMDAISMRVQVPPQIGRIIANKHLSVWLHDLPDKKEQERLRKMRGMVGQQLKGDPQ